LPLIIFIINGTVKWHENFNVIIMGNWNFWNGDIFDRIIKESAGTFLNHSLIVKKRNMRRSFCPILNQHPP